MDFYGHERMPHAAEFGALAVEDARPVGLEPGFIQPAGHGVHLDSQCRDGPAVQHVGSGDKDPHGGIDGHDDGSVGSEQTRLSGLEVLVFDHQRIEAEVAVVGVFIFPIPLVSDGLDGQVGGGDFDLKVMQPQRRQGNHGEDEYGNDDPYDLKDIVVACG